MAERCLMGKSGTNLTLPFLRTPNGKLDMTFLAV